MKKQKNNDLYSLVPLDDFKAMAGIDERDDISARFHISLATSSIEKYCRRKFIERKYFETIRLYDELCLPLNEYPIREIISVSNISNGLILEPEFYYTYPDLKNFDDVPFSIFLSPAVLRMGLKAVKIIYYAGYKNKNIPSDLSAACMELATWNFNRYKSRRVGYTGNIRKDGGSYEISMPENVKALLEPYRRKTI